MDSNVVAVMQWPIGSGRNVVSLMFGQYCKGINERAVL